MPQPKRRKVQTTRTTDEAGKESTLTTKTGTFLITISLVSSSSRNTNEIELNWAIKLSFIEGRVLWLFHGIMER